MLPYRYDECMCLIQNSRSDGSWSAAHRGGCMGSIGQREPSNFPLLRRQALAFVRKRPFKELTDLIVWRVYGEDSVPIDDAPCVSIDHEYRVLAGVKEN